MGVTFTENSRHPSSFRERREALNWSFAHLAEKANVSAAALEQIEGTRIGSVEYDAQTAFKVDAALTQGENAKNTSEKG